MKVKVYVKVVSSRRLPGGMVEDDVNGTYVRDIDVAAVPKEGDIVEYSDCGRRTDLGRVRHVVHVCQPHPSPFREPDEPWVEVVTERRSEAPDGLIEKLKGLRFYELEK